jgi:hypothetical protein
MILRAAPDSLYAYVYAQPKQDQCTPYKPGISASSSNDAWPFCKNEKASGLRVWGFFVGVFASLCYDVIDERVQFGKQRMGRNGSVYRPADSLGAGMSVALRNGSRWRCNCRVQLTAPKPPVQIRRYTPLRFCGGVLVLCRQTGTYFIDAQCTRGVSFQSVVSRCYLADQPVFQGTITG